MASMMAIESEGFDSFVREIDVSVELRNAVKRLWCMWRSFRNFGAEKQLKSAVESRGDVRYWRAFLVL